MSDCGVCIGGFDGDGYSEFFDERWPKSRKIHKCHECRREIVVGEKYQYVSGFYDGEFWTQKTCSECAEIRSVFSCGEGEQYGGLLWELMVDYVFPELTTANKCFVKLTPASKQFLLNKWNAWKFRKLAVRPAQSGSEGGTK